MSILAVLKQLEQLDLRWNSNLNQGGDREAPEEVAEVQHYPQRQEVATPISPRGPRTTVALNDLIFPIPVFQAEKQLPLPSGWAVQRIIRFGSFGRLQPIQRA